MKAWRIGILAGMGVLALSLAACAPKPKPAAVQPGDKQVALVNGRPVLQSEVRDEAMAEGLIGRDDPFDPASDVFKQTLDEVIDQRLLAAEAVARHLDADPAVQRRLAAARDRALGAALTDQVVAAATTPAQIEQMYQATTAAARLSDEVKLSQIVTKTGLEAASIKNSAQKGGESFESLALQRSIDQATRFKGGDLGGYLSVDLLPPAYAQAVRTAQIGDVVGPFEVPDGYAIVKIQDRRAEAPVSLQSARPQIIRYLTYDQIKDLVENLRAKANIQTSLPAAPAPPPAAPPPAGPVNATPSSVQAGASSLSKPAAK